MIVRIAYTVNVTDRLRRAINHHFGRPGLASALDVRAWFTERGDSANADIIQELNQAEPACAACAGTGQLRHVQGWPRCVPCGGTGRAT